jgi:hypothetical protein
VLGIALLFLLIALHPEWVLLAAASLYSLSAPALYLVSLTRRSRTPSPSGSETREVSEDPVA